MVVIPRIYDGQVNGKDKKVAVLLVGMGSPAWWD